MTARGRWTTVLATVAACALLLVLGTLAVIYSGVYDVAASEPDSALTRWLFATAADRSIEVRASAVPAPPPIDSAMLREGVEHYDEMCVSCHAAPGRDRGEIGEGLYPEPPRLDEEASDLSDRELYWILQHGIKHTGMPAFGETHPAEQLWGLVGFVRKLPELSPAEYQRLVESVEAAEESADGAGQAKPGEPAPHTHAAGTPPHSH